MADMTAFERQVGDEILRIVGPARPVDDIAVFESVAAASQSQRWGFDMFSALKYITASVIVALFGGFLLRGILTAPQGDEMAPAAVIASPSPMTTEAFLSTMVTEAVEPGVLRVINDGYRDLTTPSDPMRQMTSGAARADYLYPGPRAVIVGDVGNVWRTAECVAPAPESRCLRLYRVGQAGAWEMDPVPVDFWTDHVDAGPDGRLWALSNGAPKVFDDGLWVPAEHQVKGDFNGIAVQADGTVWLESDELCWTDETSAGCTSWTDVYHGEGVSGFVVTDDGVVWLMTEPNRNGSVSLLRFDGTEWQMVPVRAGYPGDSSWSTDAAIFAPDGGTVWTAGDPFVQHQSLTRLDTRLDEQGWTTFTAADGVGTWGGQEGVWACFPADMLKVAPDGSAWVNATIATGTRTTRTTGECGIRTCDGVARFDGDVWEPFLPGSCISDLDFAPDGSVWVVALDRGSGEVSTYVITPEAVAATE